MKRSLPSLSAQYSHSCSYFSLLFHFQNIPLDYYSTLRAAFYFKAAARSPVRCSASVNSPTTATRKLLCRLFRAKTREIREPQLFFFRLSPFTASRGILFTATGVALIYAFFFLFLFVFRKLS